MTLIDRLKSFEMLTVYNHTNVMNLNRVHEPGCQQKGQRTTG